MIQALWPTELHSHINMSRQRWPTHICIYLLETQTSYPRFAWSLPILSSATARIRRRSIYTRLPGFANSGRIPTMAMDVRKRPIFLSLQPSKRLPLAIPGNFEIPTFRATAGRSASELWNRMQSFLVAFDISNFWRLLLVEYTGLEPVTSCLQGRYSPNWVNTP